MSCIEGDANTSTSHPAVIFAGYTERMDKFLEPFLTNTCSNTKSSSDKFISCFAIKDLS